MQLTQCCCDRANLSSTIKEILRRAGRRWGKCQLATTSGSSSSRSWATALCSGLLSTMPVMASPSSPSTVASSKPTRLARASSAFRRWSCSSSISKPSPIPTIWRPASPIAGACSTARRAPMSWRSATSTNRAGSSGSGSPLPWCATGKTCPSISSVSSRTSPTTRRWKSACVSGRARWIPSPRPSPSPMPAGPTIPSSTSMPPSSGSRAIPSARPSDGTAASCKGRLPIPPWWHACGRICTTAAPSAARWSITARTASPSTTSSRSRRCMIPTAG